MRKQIKKPPPGERRFNHACVGLPSTPQIINEIATPAQQIPSRATLARRFPKLRINRLSWKWRDFATGTRGDDLESPLAFLGRAS